MRQLQLHALDALARRLRLQRRYSEAVDAAHRFWGRPTLTRATRAELIGFAARAKDAATERWHQESYAILRQNALRMLIATSPDLHTS